MPEKGYLFLFGNRKNWMLVDAIGCHLLLTSVGFQSADVRAAEWYTYSTLCSILNEDGVPYSADCPTPYHQNEAVSYSTLTVIALDCLLCAFLRDSVSATAWCSYAHRLTIK